MRATRRVGVRLVAENGQQVRAELEGVGQAGERAMAQIDIRARAMARAVTVAFAAAATGAAAAAAAMVRSGLQTVDAQAKLAQSLGTTVQSVQVLERAGELAGVAMSGIEQATKDLTRRLSQAAADMGPAVGALDRLGLSADALLRMPLDERIGAINAAIERFVPAAERAAIAGQLFGEEGSIAMSRIDTATLRTATEDIERFGVGVSEMDADQIERTNDAISRLGLVWRGLSNQLAAEAAPMLERVADALAAVTDRSGPVGAALGGLVANADRLAATVGLVAAALGGRYVASLAVAVTQTGALTSAMVALRTAMIVLGGPVGTLGALLGAAGAAYIAMQGDINQVIPTVDAVIAAQGELNAALAAFVGGAPAAGAEAIAYAKNLQEMALAAVVAAEAQVAVNRARVDAMRGFPDADRTNPALPGVQADFQASVAELERARAELENLRRTAQGLEIGQHSSGGAGAAFQLDEVVIQAEAVERALGRAGGAAGSAGTQIEDAADRAAVGWEAVLERVNAYAKEARDIGGALGDAIVSGFRGAEDAVADFVRTGKLSVSELVRSVIADFARLGARRFIFGPLSNLLSGALSNMAGGMFARSVAVPSFAGGGWTGDAPRVGGLDGRGGYMAMVHPQERIIDESRGGGGAPIVINFNGVRDMQSMRASRTQIQADIARAVGRGRRGM